MLGVACPRPPFSPSLAGFLGLSFPRAVACASLAGGGASFVISPGHGSGGFVVLALRVGVSTVSVGGLCSPSGWQTSCPRFATVLVLCGRSAWSSLCVTLPRALACVGRTLIACLLVAGVIVVAATLSERFLRCKRDE